MEIRRVEVDIRIVTGRTGIKETSKSEYQELSRFGDKENDRS